MKIMFKFCLHLPVFLPNHTCKHFASDSFYFTFTKLSFNSFNFVIWNGSPFRFDNCQYEWMRQNYNQVKQFLVYITYNLVSCLSWQKVRVPVYDIHTVHSLKSKCANTSGFILVLSFCICIKTETYHIYCFSMQTSQLITSQNLTDFQWQYLFEWCS